MRHMESISHIHTYVYKYTHACIKGNQNVYFRCKFIFFAQALYLIILVKISVDIANILMVFGGRVKNSPFNILINIFFFPSWCLWKHFRFNFSL